MRENEFFDKYIDPAEKEKMISLFESFQTEIYDFDAEKNVLNGKKTEVECKNIERYFKRAIKDLNSGSPITRYSVINFPDEGLLVDGAVLFYLISNGILQLRNQLNYNDAGLSIGMFDKTGQYQGWAQFLLQTYMQAKAEFKRDEIGRSSNSGFYGIGSEFGYYTGW